MREFPAQFGGAECARLTHSAGSRAAKARRVGDGGEKIHLAKRCAKAQQPPVTKRIKAMANITLGLKKTEDEILAFEISDAALETAAGVAKDKANFTLGACTGLSECPG